MNRARRRAVVAGLIGMTLSGCQLPRWPVEAPLTSGFGLRFLGMRPDLHRGVDLAVPTGTRVYAMAGGSVRFAGTMSGFGNVIWIDHANGLMSIYAHLHFEVWRWGRPVDPIAVLGGRPGG